MREHLDHQAQNLSILEIRRAIAHHQRAIRALRDRSSFQGIHDCTAERLIANLQVDLRALEDELGRRRFGFGGSHWGTDPLGWGGDQAPNDHARA